jgi:hypothetical protein
MKENIWEGYDRKLFCNISDRFEQINNGKDAYDLVGSYRLVKPQHQGAASIGHWLGVISELLETFCWTNPSLHYKHNAGPLKTAKCFSRRKFLGTC